MKTVSDRDPGREAGAEQDAPTSIVSASVPVMSSTALCLSNHMDATVPLFLTIQFRMMCLEIRHGMR